MAFLPLSLPCRVPFPLLRPVIESSSWCFWCLHWDWVHSPCLGLPLSPGQEVPEERDPRISCMVQWHYESWFSSLVLLLPLLFRTESHSTQGSWLHSVGKTGPRVLSPYGLGLDFCHVVLLDGKITLIT